MTYRTVGDRFSVKTFEKDIGHSQIEDKHKYAERIHDQFFACAGLCSILVSHSFDPYLCKDKKIV